MAKPINNISAEDEGKILKEYAELMASIHQKKIINNQENPYASSMQYALLNIDKLKKLGWKPLYSVSTGIQRTISEMEI